MKGTVKNKWVHGSIIAIFVILYFMVSIISTIHVIDFFKLSNPTWLAISLAVAFEIGAAASLAAIIILEKTSRFMVWSLFIILTVVQAMGNTYYAFINLADFQGWIELFGLVDAELIQQKRILSIVSGAILPIVALGFIKSLVDYIRPEESNKIVEVIKDDNLDFLGSEVKKKIKTKEFSELDDDMLKEAVEEGMEALLVHDLREFEKSKKDEGFNTEVEIKEKKVLLVPSTNEQVMQAEYYKSKLVKLKDLEVGSQQEDFKIEEQDLVMDNMENTTIPEIKEDKSHIAGSYNPRHVDAIETVNYNYDSLKKIGKDWLTD